MGVDSIVSSGSPIAESYELIYDKSGGSSSLYDGTPLVRQSVARVCAIIRLRVLPTPKDRH